MPSDEDFNNAWYSHDYSEDEKDWSRCCPSCGKHLRKKHALEKWQCECGWKE